MEEKKRVNLTSSPELPLFENRIGYPYQVLSEGIHNISPKTFFDMFVKNYAENDDARLEIYKGFLRLMANIKGWGLKGKIWVDGSFLTTKYDPDDLDVTLILDIMSVRNLGILFDDANEVLGDKERCFRDFRCDVRLVILCNSSEALYDESIKKLDEIKKGYSSVNVEQSSRPDIIKQSKGFVEIEIPSEFPSIRTNDRSPRL